MRKDKTICSKNLPEKKKKKNSKQRISTSLAFKLKKENMEVSLDSHENNCH